MQVSDLAELLDVAPNTIRRWTTEFDRFLTPTATPKKGDTRVLGDHDARVMYYVGVSRSAGTPLEIIRAHLETMQAAEWRDLPAVPTEWQDATDTISLQDARVRAVDGARIAVLQRELELTSQALQAATAREEALQTKLAEREVALEARETTLRAELEAVRGEKASIETKAHALELSLSQAQGEKSALQARLASYAFFGERPLPVAGIILVTAAAVALLVIILVIVLTLAL